MENMNRINEEKYAYWLSSIYKISHIKKRKLVECAESFKEIYDFEKLQKNPFLGLTDEDKEIIKSSKRNWDLDKELEDSLEKNIQMTFYGEADYPKRLLPYKDAPFAIFYKGKLPDENKKTVAIVGARRCSGYGEKYAAKYGELLARCGAQVISGLALGIDSIAQRAALEACGASYGILGCGVDICYPRSNIGLYHDLTSQGGVLSELPIGTPPLALHFPLRNRIISGLSDVVLIIEAKERSGSLITADLALEQGKEVYALPGMVDSELSKGCNELIKQGAGLLNNQEEFMREIGILIQNTPINVKESKKILETEEKLVYSCLCLDVKSLDWIIQESKLPIQSVINALVSLELKGYIKEISRNYYIKL